MIRFGYIAVLLVALSVGFLGSQLLLVNSVNAQAFPIGVPVDEGADSGSTDGADGADSGSTGGLRNPMEGTGINSIRAFFLAILDILLVFAIPFVVFFIIYAGFLYVTARGNPGTIEQAHKALLYAIIGGLLIFGARAILAIITNTVNSVVLDTAVHLTRLS